MTAELSRLEQLRNKVSQTPQDPGVYIHKDSNSQILYVGKAKNLQSRLRSYFTGLDRQSPKTRALVAKIDHFEVILVDNENESLLLENNLIKHNMPPYNILLRDDKTYPYLKLTLNETWPRLLVTRQRKNDGGLYFGPYSSGSDIFNLTSAVHRFFGLVKCTPNVFKTVSRPCNYYDIKRCPGPCKLPVSVDDYRKELDLIVDVLRGKSSDVSKKLKTQMTQAAEAEQFEKAGRIRDQIQAIESLTSKQSITLSPDFDADIFGYHWQGNDVCFYISALRNGRVVGGQSHLIQDPLSLEPENIKSETLVSFLCQFYQNREIPKWIVVPMANHMMEDSQKKILSTYLVGLKPEMNPELVWQSKLPKQVQSQNPTDKMLGENFKSMCDLATKNAENRMQEKLKIANQNQTMMGRLQSFLSLTELPRWIECFDVSNFQGAANVASQVVFKDGKPDKKSYKRYIIKDVIGQDDFASMREVMRRRFSEKNRNSQPDLIVLDGGEPQVREVAYVLNALGLGHIPMVGIAKSRTKSNFTDSKVTASSERIVVPKVTTTDGIVSIKFATLVLEISSPEFRLLTQMRDEAHRTAVGLHRSRRDKESLRSSLESIPGLGPARRKLLLSAFGSTAVLRTTSIADIAAKVKIPLLVLQKIKEMLEKKEELSAFSLASSSASPNPNRPDSHD